MTRTLKAGYDEIVRVAPLGVCFRDALDLRVVSDGLTVEVVDDWRPGRTQRLNANARGIFVAHALPQRLLHVRLRRPRSLLEGLRLHGPHDQAAGRQGRAGVLLRTE